MSERLFTEQEVAELITSVRDALVRSEPPTLPSDAVAWLREHARGAYTQREPAVRDAFIDGLRFRARTRTDVIARAWGDWRVRMGLSDMLPEGPLVGARAESFERLGMTDRGDEAAGVPRRRHHAGLEDGPMQFGVGTDPVDAVAFDRLMVPPDAEPDED